MKLLIFVMAAAMILTACTQKNTTMTPETLNIAPGLTAQIVTVGNDQTAKAGDTVSVHYTGTFEDGKVFDSSVSSGRPFSFTLGAGQVIKGWDLGIVGMKVGEKRTLTIAPELGYGPEGYGPIPPDSTLIFEVELLSIS